MGPLIRGFRDFTVWREVIPWLPDQRTHPQFHQCMQSQFKSSQSPCWAHFLKQIYPFTFPEMCTGHDPRYSYRQVPLRGRVCLCETHWLRAPT